MLSTLNEAAERVSTAHRAKLAYVYVRQSTAGQVRQHQESTELQYRLVNRASSLGWPRERITVIDDDLGKSGTTSTERQGFQRLIAEIGLGKAGLVLSLDASRLARNNRDWHQLLELCSIFGVIIADGERLYDPGVYHDRLLLGLSGIMSEAELHQIRLRLHQGERQKAARGELRLPLPAGLAYGAGGKIILNPDEEVQARLRFVFSTFQVLQSAKAVMRELQRHRLALPVRPLCGPAPHAVVWMPADSSRVLQILQNPAYAGAYVYGRHRQDPLRRHADAPRCATIKVPVEQWPVCLHDAHPGYIGWEEFMANQKRLAGNVASRAVERPGAPRRGWALLQGIAVCARCGRRMTLRYSGPHGDYPLYQCNADQAQDGSPRCQEVRALPVDALVEQVLLKALAPEQIALALPPSGNSRRRPNCWNNNGHSSASAPAMTPNGRGGNTTRLNPRTASSPVRWSGSGRRSYANSRGSSRPMTFGATNRQLRLTRTIVPTYAPWRRICHTCGAPRRRPSANGSCAWSCGT
jgi:DNA invertase Pin-like site-specific DNA recombinase